MQRLPDALVDQIAAGEVVERPASVVKELVENALDAEAGRVRVEVREGGSALVAVTDDGIGMTPADALLALERHATSKLRTLADLEAIGSFGFRGEALPAIASVSRLRLRTRARGAEEGCEVRVEGGRAPALQQSGGPVGTRVEVADLFAAVPARRKFLKAPATEWGHVGDWLARVALARPDVHFDVARDGRDVFAWPAVGDPVERIAAVLSEREAAALVAGEGAAGALAVRVFASRPDAHRPTGAGIHLFVDGRPVRDRLLRHAVLQVYRDLLPRGRFPTALVFLRAGPRAVDVNVHPAKWEVRFADPQAVHRLVGGALRDALARRSWLATPGAVPGANAAAHADAAHPVQPFQPTGRWPARLADSPAAVAEPGAGDWVLARDASARGAPAGAAPRPFRFADLHLVGQLLGTYLVLEDKQAMVLVDQHAAHERVLYERLRAGWLEGEVARQALLLPVTAELDPGAAAALARDAEALERLGFEVEAFGAGAVVVRTVPALLAGRDPVALVRGLADELAAAGEGAAPLREASRMLDAADRVFASMACHAARRAGDVLDRREQRGLVDALDAIPWAPTCPHGRPVALPIPLGEIERRFGR